MRNLDRLSLFALFLCLFLCTAVHAESWRESVVPPKHVSIRPVFLMPQGAPGPTQNQKIALLRYIQIAQSRYKEMLLDEGTFSVDEETLVVGLTHPVGFYRNRPQDGVPEMTGELLDYLQVSRFSCPWIFVIVVMNPALDFPPGGGRPLNGGINTGGGVVVMSSSALDSSRNFESTLQHELGHAFGLPHVDTYGRDMQNDSSLMSYNPRHHTSGYTASPTPGILVSQDLGALAKNRRVFPDLLLGMRSSDITLGPMDIPGHPPARLRVTTTNGETYGSVVTNVIQQEVIASAGPGITFDGSRMWHSAASTSGWVALNFEFPVGVSLSRIRIHTEHSGKYHAAIRTRIAFVGHDDTYGLLADKPLAGSDVDVLFAPATSRRWRIELQATQSKQVVVRGIRFFQGADEIVLRP